MKQKIVYLFLWSWLVTVPLTMIGGYLVYRTVDRFYTFSVRYNPYPDSADLSLKSIVDYEWGSVFLSVKAAVYRYFNKQQQLNSIHLFASKADLATINAHLPQSGYQYIKAALAIDGKLIKAKIRYRGDFSKHWAWGKKSFRVKTSKETLYHGLHKFNLIAPAFIEQLNDYFAYKLAGQMGLLTPTTDLLHVYLNGEYLGIHILVEQLSEITLRRSQRMPSDIYRGELYGKDAYKDSGVNTLFETAAVWDKVAVNNHYNEHESKSLERLIALLQDRNSILAQKELSQLLDMDAWAKFSFFESLVQTWHYDSYHNWRLTYDPWTQKLTPIVWDPVGWATGWFPDKTPEIVDRISITKLHRALFQNGDFLRARNKVEIDFYSTKNDELFLGFVDKTIKKMQVAVKKDPALNTPNVKKVSEAILQLKGRIENVFRHLKKMLFESDASVLYQYRPNQLRVYLSGHRSVKKILLEFDKDFVDTPLVKITFEGGVLQKNNTSFNPVSVNRHQLIINTELLVHNNTLFSQYRLDFSHIKPEQKLLSVMVDYGNGWENAERGEEKKISLLREDQTKISIQSIRSTEWTLFYDVGKGFNAKQSQSVKGDIDNNSRWTYTVNLPSSLQNLRVDFPDKKSLQISDVQLTISGKKYFIDVNLLQLNGLKREGKAIKSYGHEDPYFSFNVRSFFEQLEGSTQQVLVSFNVAEELDKIYEPVQQSMELPPLIWSGEIRLNGVTTIVRPLYIKPGTRILMATNASLIIKNRLHAIGTEKEPIRFLPHRVGSLPWGAVVLMGEKANASTLQYCEFAEGSGFKADLFEYTAMLSIQNVKNVNVTDCLFRDNHIVDDMVHIVYSEISFLRNIFRHAWSDALDIDISLAIISDSVFENNGNDAIDLMTTQANITNSVFHKNRDKGISVGENSQLFAVNNKITNNAIGIQVKDASTALLFNQQLDKNKVALSAYKKNWRYGKGGLVVLSKSILLGNEKNLEIKKSSKVYLFDNYIDGDWAQKRVKGWFTDAKNKQTNTHLLLDQNILAIPEVNKILKNRSEKLLEQRDSTVRGAILSND